MTFSIVARDRKTGEFGVAVQSHWFSVGSSVCWARAGVGAVATQSATDISYGPLGLDLMFSGKSAQQALEALARVDANVDRRQVAMIDSKGRVAVRTGKLCCPSAGKYEGEQFSCQANLMKNGRIWGEMAAAFEQGRRMQFAERLVFALEAGQKAGGDLRGMQSAALLVVGPEITAGAWQGVSVNLRVEDNAQPITELRRLLKLQRVYTMMSKGALLLANGKYKESTEAYMKAHELAPDLDEARFWHAVSLLHAGEESQAKGMLIELSKKSEDWIRVAKNLQRIGRIPRDATISIS